LFLATPARHDQGLLNSEIPDLWEAYHTAEGQFLRQGIAFSAITKRKGEAVRMSR
jgi:hypothetical protein